ncbi:LuxR family transcriptional regulator [Gordonia paraffinivorans]|uniref:helix-turn-helix transcriptional regulator n=1 Tax=Gordonia paraffinivorans TaxID=175628 RepID=UPI001C92D212|nr:LuxR C-terminal-related transcriptional regulator [Gordonia paraffinivorans]MBY4575518.1 LuxR family transcriptional regulator [Gordonia paraffinivorans]
MTADLPAQAVLAAIEALGEAARQLDASAGSATRGVVDAGTALEMITSMEHVLSRLCETPERRATARDLRASRAELLANELARQRSKMSEVTHQIARIRSARTVEDLAGAVPLTTAGLGYERALFSWVENERWVPRAAHAMDDPQVARAMVSAGGPPFQEVRYLHEVQVVRERKPILVLGAINDPRVHPTIQPVTRSVTYAAAPVVARGRVAGMVHIDRNLDTGLNDEFDRDLLALFCENIGVTFERLLATAETTEALPDSVDTDWWDALTEREREVLRLVADGLTNAEISARLYVSPETTKSHIKRLMRKMGVKNRSQAGAMYHTTQ